MGLYFRKSVRVGPFRFNLSSSGIGVSTGIKGFRIGSGPRGTYVHMGRNGLYYRQTLDRLPLEIPSPSSATHGPTRSIGSADVVGMVDSNSAELLNEIELRRKRPLFWPFCLVTTLLISAALIANHAALWIVIAIVAPLLLLTYATFQIDSLNKTVVLMYDVEDEGLQSYETLLEAIHTLADCGAVWHVTGHSDVYNPKYHGGASGLIDRCRLRVNYVDPPWIRTNLKVPSLAFRATHFYFLPDLILARTPNGYGAIGYGSLRFDISQGRFIEDEALPHDAVVLGHTWRFVNKDGGPDRRFNNNRQIPICRYEQLLLTNTHGVHELLQLSSCGVADQLRNAVGEMADRISQAISRAELIEQEKTKFRPRLPSPGLVRLEAKDQTIPENQQRSMQSLLFDLLCCMMVADGHISASEVSKINQIMSKIRPGWTDEHCRARIETFMRKVESHGYSLVLEETLSFLKMIKEQGRQQILIKCVESVASADGSFSDREQRLVQRIRAELKG